MIDAVHALDLLFYRSSSSLTWNNKPAVSDGTITWNGALPVSSRYVTTHHPCNVLNG